MIMRAERVNTERAVIAGALICSKKLKQEFKKAAICEKSLMLEPGIPAILGTTCRLCILEVPVRDETKA